MKVSDLLTYSADELDKVTDLDKEALFAVYFIVTRPDKKAIAKVEGAKILKNQRWDLEALMGPENFKKFKEAEAQTKSNQIK